MINIGGVNRDRLIILLLAVSGIQSVVFPGPTVRVVIQFVIFSIVCIVLAKSFNTLAYRRFDYKSMLVAYFVFSGFVVVHSIVLANSYEQWRYLATVYLPTLLLPIFSMLAASAKSFFNLFKGFVKYVFPLSFIFFIMGPSDKNSNLAYIHYAAYIYFFLVFYWYCNNKLRVLFAVALIFSIFFDLSNRANLLSLALSIAVVTAQFFVTRFGGRKYDHRKGLLVFSSMRRLFLLLPLLLILFAWGGDFNPFQDIASTESDKITAVDTSGRLIITDSRSSIYSDAYNYLTSQAIQGGWLWGGSAVVMPETSLRYSNDGYERGRLGGNESGFLTLLIFGGVIYVLLFFLICFVSSSLAIYRSNNLLAKSIGVFIAIRWAMTFIESPLELNFLWITHFMAIGLALSSEFRSLSDGQLLELGRRNWEV